MAAPAVSGAARIVSVGTLRFLKLLPPVTMHNTTKKFLIQFECAPETKWLLDDSHVAAALESIAHNVTALYTNGPLPRIAVTIEEHKAPCLHTWIDGKPCQCGVPCPPEMLPALCCNCKQVLNLCECYL